MGPPRTEEQEGSTLAVLAELWPLAFVVLSCFAFVAPLILFLTQRDRNRFVRWHAAEGLNAALTALLVGAGPVIAGYVSFFDSFFDRSVDDGLPALFGVGIAVSAVVGLLALAMGVLGAVRASQGVWWRNPLAIPFLRAHRHERVAESLDAVRTGP
jgi:uncharacterized Tic20 family protein